MHAVILFTLCVLSIFASVVSSKNVPPRIPQCKPSLGLNQRQCNQRMKACNKNGKFPPRMKWNTPGGCDDGKPAGDSGCQCAPYCGYTCEKACTSDKSCFWDVDVCKSKETGLPTGPMTNCNTCLFQKCGSPGLCGACDGNTECVNGVCLTQNDKPCNSDYHCSGGECTDGKCKSACDAPGESCDPGPEPGPGRRALDVLRSVQARNTKAQSKERKLGYDWNQGTCCSGSLCGEVDKGVFQCCKEYEEPCSDSSECCSDYCDGKDGVCQD